MFAFETNWTLRRTGWQRKVKTMELPMDRKVVSFGNDLIPTVYRPLAKIDRLSEHIGDGGGTETEIGAR